MGFWEKCLQYFGLAKPTNLVNNTPHEMECTLVNDPVHSVTTDEPTVKEESLHEDSPLVEPEEELEETAEVVEEHTEPHISNNKSNDSLEDAEIEPLKDPLESDSE